MGCPLLYPVLYKEMGFRNICSCGNAASCISPNPQCGNRALCIGVLIRNRLSGNDDNELGGIQTNFSGGTPKRYIAGKFLYFNRTFWGWDNRDNPRDARWFDSGSDTYRWCDKPCI